MATRTPSEKDSCSETPSTKVALGSSPTRTAAQEDNQDNHRTLVAAHGKARDKTDKSSAAKQNGHENEDCEPLASLITPANKVSLEKAYSFLSSCSFTQLRLMARKWKVVQTQATQKRILLARIFFFIQEQIHQGDHDVQEILSADYSWGYMKYLQEWTPGDIQQSIPSIAILRKDMEWKPKGKGSSKEPKSTSRTTSKRRKASSPENRKTKKRSASGTPAELGRILLIFQLYGEIRDRFQQTLSRADLDNGVKSKDFWEDDVAKFFNDSNFKPAVSLSPALKGVNPSKLPTEKRDGSFLQNMLRKFQPQWGEVEGGFRVSGQNCADFEEYLKEVRKRDVFSGVGQMLLLCGEIVRIGTSQEDADLLEILSRKSTAQGNEGGLQRKLPGYVMLKEEKSPRSKTQKRASLDNAAVAFTDLCDSVKRSFAESNSGGPNWDFNVESDMLEALSKAEKYANDQKLSDRLRKRWQDHYDKIEADMDKRSPMKAKSIDKGN